MQKNGADNMMAEHYAYYTYTALWEFPILLQIIHLHLRGSFKLYSEIFPQIATLPNSFMLGRTVLKNTPPTYIQLHIEALNIASKGKRYVCASLWCETKLR